MCAKHRSQKLDEIRGRLKNGEPCRVIATSLIEAGVDVDFPLVMRAEAGLDSVAQAAGRCNREGKRPFENSFVWVFAPEDKWKAPPELAAQAAVMRLTADSFSDDLLSTQAVAAYFAELYQLKGSELEKNSENAQRYRAKPRFPIPNHRRQVPHDRKPYAAADYSV